MTSQAPPRRKTSILTRWPTEENPSAVYQPGGQLYQLQAQQPQQLQPHWLPPVDYDDDEEEDATPSAAGAAGAGTQLTVSTDPGDRSVEFQQQQALSLEERQMRRKVSISNITGKVKIPSRRRSVIEFSAEFRNNELQAAASHAAAAAAAAPPIPSRQQHN